MTRKISRRMAIIKVMTKPKIPSEIHEEALEGAVSLSNTTEILNGLTKEDLVVCINENEKVGRLYALTTKGKTLKKKEFGSESTFHELSTEIIADYARVMRGKHRRALIKVMDGRKTPSQIHQAVVKSCENLSATSIHYVKLSLNSTSDTLRGFRKKGIAVCINPESRVKRLYELTEKGKTIREQILKE